MAWKLSNDYVVDNDGNLDETEIEKAKDNGDTLVIGLPLSTNQYAPNTLQSSMSLNSRGMAGL